MAAQNNPIAAMQDGSQPAEGLILTKLDQALTWARSDGTRQLQ